MSAANIRNIEAAVPLFLIPGRSACPKMQRRIAFTAIVIALLVGPAAAQDAGSALSTILQTAKSQSYGTYLITAEGRPLCAACVKLSWRAAASKALTAFSDGSRRGMASEVMRKSQAG
jgi:hypothetical protein